MSLQFDLPEVDPREVAALDAELETASLEGILRFAASRFPGRVGFATAFGPEGCVIVDAIGRERLAIDVFTLDTGLLFPETIELWETLERRYDLRIRAVRPAQDVAEQAAQYGRALWERLPDRCCELRKIEPLRRELSRFDAWVSSIRRDQTADRASARTRRWEAPGRQQTHFWEARDIERYRYPRVHSMSNLQEGSGRAPALRASRCVRVWKLLEAAPLPGKGPGGEGLS